MIEIIIGETIRSNNGSYKKLECKLSKETEATQERINRLFAMARKGIAEQLKIDGNGEKSPDPLC